MQKITTTNDPAEPTTDPAALFEELIAARRAARAEEKAQAARDDEARDTEKRTNAIAKWNMHVANRISDDLQEALPITVTVEHTDPDDPTSGYRAVGRFTSPITGNPCELYVGYSYGDHFPALHLITINQYIHLPGRSMHEEQNALDAPLLDALEDEQVHIARHEEDTRAEAEQTAEQKAEEAAAKAVPFYELVEGRDTDGRGLLHVGSRVWLTVETPELDEHCKHETRCCDIVDWSDTWLLVKTRPGRQKLIPIARITEIQPASPTTQLG